MLEFLFKNIDNLIIILFVLFYLSICIFYIKLYFNIIYKKRIFSTINDLFSSNSLNKENTLNMIVKDIIINKKDVNISTPCELLEFVFRKVTMSLKKTDLVICYGVKFNNDTIKKIQDYIIEMKNKDPYISLNSQYNYYFSSIYNAINDNNKEYGISMLNQLSKEFETIDEKVLKQESRNKLNSFFTIISIVITIFFGFFSLLNK